MLSFIREHRWSLRGIWLALVALVVTLSLLPAESKTLMAITQIVVNDKLQHTLAYTPLAFIPFLHERRKTALISTLAMALVGVAMEFGQLHVHGRSFDVFDMMANCAGLLLGVVLALPVRSKLGPKP